MVTAYLSRRRRSLSCRFAKRRDERFSRGVLCRILSYFGIGKYLLARVKMLPDTYVFDNGLLCEQYCRYGMIWALFPLGFFPKSSPYCKHR
jgi:hypothetical protein